MTYNTMPDVIYVGRIKNDKLHAFLADNSSEQGYTRTDIHEATKAELEHLKLLIKIREGYETTKFDQVIVAGLQDELERFKQSHKELLRTIINIEDKIHSKPNYLDWPQIARIIANAEAVINNVENVVKEKLVGNE